MQRMIQSVNQAAVVNTLTVVSTDYKLAKYNITG